MINVKYCFFYICNIIFPLCLKNILKQVLSGPFISDIKLYSTTLAGIYIYTYVIIITYQNYYTVLVPTFHLHEKKYILEDYELLRQCDIF